MADELDPEIWSNWTVDGKRLTWKELAEHHESELVKANRWAVMAADLDRCEHGRHEGDVCGGESGCNGPSRGNLILPTGSEIGHDISGNCYVIPPRAQMHDPDAWVRPR